MITPVPFRGKSEDYGAVYKVLTPGMIRLQEYCIPLPKLSD